MKETSSLELAVSDRAKGRALSLNLVKMKYALESFLLPAQKVKAERALFVGVGHGHDALIALSEGTIGEIVGVDPYIESDGNGDNDYHRLNELISELGMDKQFKVYKETIQEFLERGSGESFDLIVISDVLHHIFVTEHLLDRSSLIDGAVKMFADLRHLAIGGTLAVADVERHGLRPFLTKTGLLSGEVDYRTKQPHRQWINAATKGGWRLEKKRSYVPFAFRRLALLSRLSLTQYTVGDKYFLYFKQRD